MGAHHMSNLCTRAELQMWKEQLAAASFLQKLPHPKSKMPRIQFP